MKRYLRTASCGLTLGAGLAVLWLILGSHTLFFTACAAILYSVVLPIAMMHSIDTTGVSVFVKRQLVMMGKPDMVSVSLTGTGTRSPLLYDVSLSLPPYLVKKHERHAHLGLMVFFEANRRGEYQAGDTIVTVQDPPRGVLADSHLLQFTACHGLSPTALFSPAAHRSYISARWTAHAFCPKLRHEPAYGPPPVRRRPPEPHPLESDCTYRGTLCKRLQPQQAIASRDAYRSLVAAVKTEIESKRGPHSRVVTIK